MKYVIMFTSTPELDAAVPEERAQEVYGRIYEWFQTNGDKISDGGAELMPVTTATTVKHGANGDGPGGYTLVYEHDADTAATGVREAYFGQIGVLPAARGRGEVRRAQQRPRLAVALQEAPAGDRGLHLVCVDAHREFRVARL